MVQINFAQKQVNAKIVYYGPGMSGKTTNLEVIHQRAPEANKGDLTSISTDGDRTLFFDFMPLDLGTVAGMRTSFQIYTVPGQVYYNSTRKLVLQGVDGVVFVADSSPGMVEENLESLRNLEENLADYGKNLATLPHIIQFNKRDLPDAMPVDELNAVLNRYNVPTFEAIANTGQGVFPTLKALAAAVLESIHSGSNASPSGARPAPAPQAPAPAAAKPSGPAAAPRRPAQVTPPKVVPPVAAPAPVSPAANPVTRGREVAATSSNTAQTGLRLASETPQQGGQVQKTSFQPIHQPQPRVQNTGLQTGGPAVSHAQARSSSAQADPRARSMAPSQLMANESPARAPAPRPAAAPPQPSDGARFRPRQSRPAPRPTPRVGKSSSMYATIFILLAVAVGVVLTKVVFKFF